MSAHKHGELYLEGDGEANYLLSKEPKAILDPRNLTCVEGRGLTN